MKQLLYAFLLLFPRFCLAQNNPSIFDPPPEPIRFEATEVRENIRIDGKIEEADWQVAKVYQNFVQKNPVQGAAATFDTEVRILFDHKYLYISAVCRQPMRRNSDVRAQNLRRDFDFDENDLFGISIDGFLDKRNCLTFQTLPYGAQRDVQVTDSDNFNREWDALWNVRTHIDTTGWTAEFAIPWKTLRYPAGTTEMGVIFFRNIRSLNEETSLPAVPRVFTPYRMAYEALLTGITPPPPTANIQVNPYLLYDVNRNQLATNPTELGVKPKIGGEVKWAIKPNTVLDLTLNTDFAQADADRQVVNLTRFSVLFPERRQFFLEGATLFNATLDDFIQPFFSRRIGLDDEGNKIALDGGLRLTHSDNKRNIGALVVRQRATDRSPTTHYGVFRYSQNFGEQSRVGGMVTYRNDAAFVNENKSITENTNYTATVDALFRPSQRWNVGLMATTSKDTRLGDGLAGQGWVAYQDNVMYLGLLEMVNINYQPGIGLERFGQDYLMTSPAIDLDLRPKWLPKFIRSYEPDAFIFAFHNPNTGRLIGADARISPLDLTFQTGANVELAFEPSWQVLIETDDFVGTPIGAGRYEFTRTRLGYNSDQSKKYGLSAEVAMGPYYDGKLSEYTLEVRLAPLPHIELSADYGLNRFQELGIENKTFNTNLLGINGRFALNPRIQLIGFYQRNTAVNRDVWNVRFSWEYRPLSYIFLVFNSNHRNAINPTDRLRQDQAIAKITFLRQL